ncbi:unnamed protein product [Mucor hiemalis]
MGRQQYSFKKKRKCNEAEQAYVRYPHLLIHLLSKALDAHSTYFEEYGCENDGLVLPPSETVSKIARPKKEMAYSPWRDSSSSQKAKQKDNQSQAEIIKDKPARREGKQRYQERESDALKDTADFAFDMVQSALYLEGAWHQPVSLNEGGQVEEEELGEEEEDQGEEEDVNQMEEAGADKSNEGQRLEENSHSIAYKKIAGIKVVNVDDIETHNGSPPKKHLLKTAAELLAKFTLNMLEQHSLELCLSSVYNQINFKIDDIQKINQTFQVPTLNLRGMDSSLQLFDQVLGLSDDADLMLSFIQESKYTLSKEKKSLSETYIMLNILVDPDESSYRLRLLFSVAVKLRNRGVDNFNLWNGHSKDSELTFYRRSAEVLDCLFVDISMKVADGEVGSRSTKTAIETNKALFHVTNNAPTYPGKIDLSLTLNEATTVELSSSEWKRSSISDLFIILKQQTKT